MILTTPPTGSSVRIMPTMTGLIGRSYACVILSCYPCTLPNYLCQTPNQTMETTDVPPSQHTNTSARRLGLVVAPVGERYTSQWLIDRPPESQCLDVINHNYNVDAAFNARPTEAVSKPSLFLLDAAYGSAILHRYSNIPDRTAGELSNFPSYVPTPEPTPADPVYQPEDDEHSSDSPGTPGADSGSNTAQDSDDNPMSDPLLFILSLLPRELNDEVDGFMSKEALPAAVCRWRDECELEK